PSLAIQNVSVAEGDSGMTPAVLAVVLSGVHPRPVVVSFITQDGTATAGSDYIFTNGILAFSPSVSTQYVTVMVQGDRVQESDETFFVSLQNPINAILGSASGQGTILNDDGLPGKVDHFTWEPISSTQLLNQPFAVTIAA